MRPAHTALLLAGALTLAAGCSSSDEPTARRETTETASPAAVVASLPIVTVPSPMSEPVVVAPPSVTPGDQQPEDVGTLVKLARARMNAQDADGALEAAEGALRLAPDSVGALHQKGRALAARDEGIEALAVLRRAHELDPDNGYVANTLGWLHLVRGENAEAVTPLERARELLPGTAYVRNNLGVVYERLGRLDEAAAEYEAAIGAGDSGKAARGLARIERKQRSAASSVAVVTTDEDGEPLPDK